MSQFKSHNNGPEIKRRLLAGDSYRKISKELNVSKSTVNFHAKKIGLAAVIVKRSGPKRVCKICEKPLRPHQIDFCSRICKQKEIYQKYIEAWKSGKVSGIKESSGSISRHVRRYLYETRGMSCEICSWKEVNPITGKVPITVDHIDGHWQNASEDNLRILCPNCHSLTPTFQALNRGNGHPWRRKHYTQQIRNKNTDR